MGGARAYGSSPTLENQSQEPYRKNSVYNKSSTVLTAPSLFSLFPSVIPLDLGMQDGVCTWLSTSACTELQPFLFPE